MLNSYNWGGYLMFAAAGVPVYVDGRTDLYDDAFLRQYLDIILLRTGWQEALDQQDIDFIVIEADSVLAAMLRTQPDTWIERRFDDDRSALSAHGRQGVLSEAFPPEQYTPAAFLGDFRVLLYLFIGFRLVMAPSAALRL
jgi:hypothetical protein